MWEGEISTTVGREEMSAALLEGGDAVFEEREGGRLGLGGRRWREREADKGVSGEGEEEAGARV